MRSKLMILGEEMVGKTATVRSMLGEEFKEKWISTVGISLTQVQSGDGIWRKDNHIDYATTLANQIASKQHTPLEPMQVTGQQLGVFSSISEKVMQFLPSNRTGATLTSPPGTLIVPEDAARKFDRQELLSWQFDEKSVNFTVWDYGGQRVFSSVHQLFLSKLGVYFIVFDLASGIEGKRVLYWLNCVHMYANGVSGLYYRSTCSVSNVFMIGTGVSCRDMC